MKMFDWLFQLFGKTDYKKLKKELENEIRERKINELAERWARQEIKEMKEKGIKKKFEDINRVREKIKQRKHAK